jgi:hypothetical protein
MRSIERASAFKRDYKREAKGQGRATLDDVLRPILVALATDQPLDTRCCRSLYFWRWLSREFTASLGPVFQIASPSKMRSRT